MPNRRLILASLVFGLAALTVSMPVAHAIGIHHGEKRDAKHQVEDLEEQWRNAVLTRDVSTMDRLLSEDYVGISMTGMVNTKAQQLTRLQNRTVSLTRMDLSDVKVKLVGPVAIVTSLATIEGTNDGTSVSGVYRYTRVYQRNTAGAWKITNFEATRIANGNRLSSAPVPSLNSPAPGIPARSTPTGTTPPPPRQHLVSIKSAS